MLHKSLVACAATAVLAARSEPASAFPCAGHAFTPYDLVDRAATVAIMEVDVLSRTAAGLVLVETIKGDATAPATLNVDLRSGCSPRIERQGVRGVVYISAAGDLLGLFAGFETDPEVIDAVRAYGSPTSSVAHRASALVELAIGKGNGSFAAAEALANRIELVAALDANAREDVVRRLGKSSMDNQFIIFAARLHDARVRKLQKHRKFDGGAELRSVLAGRFDAVDDPNTLADAIAASGTKLTDRVAAMERCEQVRGRSLDRITDYYWDDGSITPWTIRSEACRSGQPIVDSRSNEGVEWPGTVVVSSMH